jgi:protein SCO1/2
MSPVFATELRAPSRRLRARGVVASALAFLSALLLTGLLSTSFAGTAGAVEELDRLEAKPERLDGVELQEQLGSRVDLEQVVLDSQGKRARLGEFLDGRHPTILTFNYANCPMLCGLQLPRFVAGLRELTRTVGDEFEVLTLSIDPKETSGQAAASKAHYLGIYARPEANNGWHFLTANEAQARAIASSVGISYTFNQERQEWLHPAVVVVLTPDGRISRYLYGIQYDPETLNLALVEASEGKIGTVVDRLVLYCFHYDEREGRYAPVAMNIMRVGAGLVAVVLALFLSVSWIVEARRRRAATLAQSTAS